MITTFRLNEDVRRAEMNEDKVRKEARSKERLARQVEDIKIYRLTLDTVDKPNLQPIVFPGKTASTKKGPKVSPEAAPDADSDSTGDDDGTKEPAIDPERDETLNILSDLVNLSRGPTTASASAPAKPVSPDCRVPEATTEYSPERSSGFTRPADQIPQTPSGVTETAVD